MCQYTYLPRNSRIWGGFQDRGASWDEIPIRVDPLSIFSTNPLGFCFCAAPKPSWVREPWQGDPGGSGWEISVVPAFPAALDSNPLWILTSSGLRCFLCLHLSTVLAWLGGGQWIFSSGEKQRAEVGWMWCLVVVKGKAKWGISPGWGGKTRTGEYPELGRMIQTPKSHSESTAQILPDSAPSCPFPRQLFLFSG